jgi:hypothetical protein
LAWNIRRGAPRAPASLESQLRLPVGGSRPRSRPSRSFDPEYTNDRCLAPNLSRRSVVSRSVLVLAFLAVIPAGNLLLRVSGALHLEHFPCGWASRKWRAAAFSLGKTPIGFESQTTPTGKMLYPWTTLTKAGIG